jgi:hypothetical protein
LDNLRIDNIEIEIKMEKKVKLKGVIEGVKVRKIEKLVIEKIKENIMILRIEFGISVKEIVEEGEK